VKNVKIHRYSNPKAHGWAGWIEPEDRSWIAFVGRNGLPMIFLHRDPKTGAILSDDPAEHAEGLARLAREGGPRIGMLYDGSGDPAGLVVGEPVFPLGYDGTGDVSTWSGHGSDWPGYGKPWPSKTKWIVTNLECVSEEWWLAAAERSDEFPTQTRLFVSGLRAARAEVDADQADKFLEIAKTLPGWCPPYPVTVSAVA